MTTKENALTKMKPETEEQKEWFLRGYVECLISQISLNFNVTEKEAKKYAAEVLKKILK